MTTVITPEYWPPISHVAQWYGSSGLEIQSGGTYQKQSYLNRCKIAGVKGTLTLSVPLIGGREQKAFLKDVLIDSTQRWAVQHLRTIRSCYGKAPFFDYYFPFIETLLSRPHPHLVELNREILKNLIRWLKWQGTVHDTEAFVHPIEKDAAVLAPYVQVFADRQPFQPNLSILDLLFCLGPDAKGYLQVAGQQFGS